MNLHERVQSKLLEEIRRVEETLLSAKSCINDTSRDYAQCAVRLEMLGAKFSEFEMDVFEGANTPI